MTEALATETTQPATGYANEITAKCLRLNQSEKLSRTTRTSMSERLTGELELRLARKCVLRFMMFGLPFGKGYVLQLHSRLPESSYQITLNYSNKI